MLHWLFNMYMDRVMRQVKAGVRKQRQVLRIMSGENQEWEFSKLLIPDGTAFVALLKEKNSSLVKDFGKVC